MSQLGCEDDAQSAVGPCSSAGLPGPISQSQEFARLLREFVEQITQAHNREVETAQELQRSPSTRSGNEPTTPSFGPGASSQPEPPKPPLPRLEPDSPRARPPALGSPLGADESACPSRQSQSVASPASAYIASDSEAVRASKSVKSKVSRRSFKSVSQAASIPSWIGASSTQTASISWDCEGDASGEQVPRWQWMHRTGWRNYQKHESDVIESVYQAGESKARLKSGKQGRHPMEVFFREMIQHDNSTDMVRNVRRLGPDPWWQKANRYFWSYYREFQTGRPRQESFKAYRQATLRQNSSADMTDGIKRAWLSRNPTGIINQGCCKRATRSLAFTVVTMFMVFFNTLWIGVEANQDEQVRQDDVSFLAMEQLFCTFFFLEILVRLGSYERKKDCLRSTWFIVDAICTFSMVIEAWIIPLVEAIGLADEMSMVNLGVIRAFRLLRITRMTRLARLMPEFVTMMKGILAALRSVGVTIVMSVMFLYMFGIIFRSQVESGSLIEMEYFSSVQHSMWSLLFHGTLLDAVSKVANEIHDQSKFLSAMFLLCIFLTSFTVLNMLIGIICGVVTAVQSEERERKAKKLLRKQLLDIMEVYDGDCSSSLDSAEFGLFIGNPDVKRCLQEFDVDVWALTNLVEHLFDEADDARAGSPSLLFDHLLDVVVRLRGDNKIQMHDVIQLRKFTDQRLDSIEAALAKDPSRLFSDGKEDDGGAMLRKRSIDKETGGEAHEVPARASTKESAASAASPLPGAPQVGQDVAAVRPPASKTDVIQAASFADVVPAAA